MSLPKTLDLLGAKTPTNSCSLHSPHKVFFRTLEVRKPFFEFCSKENGKGNHPKQTYTGKASPFKSV